MFPVPAVLSGVPLRLVGYVLAALALLACAVAVKHLHDGWIDDVDRAGYDRAKSELMAEALRQSERARNAETNAAAKVVQLEERHRATQSDLARAAAGTRAELDRLRDQLAAMRSGDRGAAADSAAAPGADGTAAAAVVGECASQLVEVAESADTVAERLRSLQTYVAQVCAAPRL